MAADRRAAVLSVRAWAWYRWLACLQAVAAVMVAVAIPAVSAPVFNLTNVALPGVAYSSVACGDFNLDGQLDVLLAGADGSFNGICQVWQNHSNGRFTNLNAALPGISSSAVARGDLDNDGRPDLLLTGFAGVDGNRFPVYLSQVWLNPGSGTFTNVQAGLPGVDTGAVALGDYDSDGYLDILLTGYSSTGAVSQIWRNLGNGTFTNLNARLPGVLYSSVAWGDFDRDGLLDILLTGTPDGFVTAAISQVWRNMGNGSFSNINVALPGVTQGAVAWGDFNQDGWLDLLLTGHASTGAVCQAWLNLGNGIFVKSNTHMPGVYQSCVALGDYENDGKLDIALAGVGNDSNPVCQVWRNNGSLSFTNINAGFPGTYSGSMAWADFDNDGRLDLLLSGLDNGGTPGLWLYHNNTASSNVAAPRIKGLRSLGTQGRLLSFDGHIGFGYTVWASTNLNQWSSLGVPNEASPSTFQFTDRTANLRHRYYRLSRP